MSNRLPIVIRRAPATSQAGLVFLVLLGLLGISAGDPPVATPQKDGKHDVSRQVDAAVPLTVMTFNIRFGTANDGENHWNKRHEYVFETIRRYSPDIIGMQEVLKFQLDALKEALPRYEAFGVGRDDGKQKGEYSAILYDHERLERLDGGTFWFSDTPEKVCSTSWGNDLCRICTWARFHDRKTGHNFYHFNVHLDHRSANSRLLSADLVIRRIDERSPADPVFLTGDFNTGEDTSPIRLIKASPVALKASDAPVKLVDTYRVKHPDVKDIGTFNSFKGERTGPKIDYIFTPETAFEILDADIARDAYHGHYPSDHFPVWAKLRFK